MRFCFCIGCYGNSSDMFVCLSIEYNNGNCIYDNLRLVRYIMGYKNSSDISISIYMVVCNIGFDWDCIGCCCNCSFFCNFYVFGIGVFDIKYFDS